MVSPVSTSGLQRTGTGTGQLRDRNPDVTSEGVWQLPLLRARQVPALPMPSWNSLEQPAEDLRSSGIGQLQRVSHLLMESAKCDHWYCYYLVNAITLTKIDQVSNNYQKVLYMTRRKVSYHSVNVISFSLSQSYHMKWLNILMFIMASLFTTFSPCSLHNLTI